ncbi:MAG: YIP1 family protein [Rhodobacteraceae bacterium]|nr:YIP1 family protein [Paracoccaceae bacterium]
MSVAAEIVRSWWSPRRTMARVLGSGAGEERALAFLMIACLLFFIARLPALQVRAEQADGLPFAGLAAGAALGAMILAPLVFYGLSTLSHWVARALGGRGSAFAARLALFWSLLAVAPLVLLVSALGTLPGLDQLTGRAGLAVGLLFLFIWVNSLLEAERAR